MCLGAPSFSLYLSSSTSVVDQKQTKPNILFIGYSILELHLHLHAFLLILSIVDHFLKLENLLSNLINKIN